MCTTTFYIILSEILCWKQLKLFFWFIRKYFIVKLNHLNHFFRNKLIVTKHQSQSERQPYQINNLQQLPVAVNLHSFSKKLDKTDDEGELAPNDCLSDSTIEKMRLQIQIQREKVEEER